MIVKEESVYFIERTKYSRPETPKEKREYTIVGLPNDSPVGTIKEWTEWAIKNNKVVVIQAVGKKILEEGETK